MKVGVVTFPGSLDDVDAQRAVRFGGHEAVPLWHGDHDLRGVDAVILPGGFSYGDYLRCGAISRFSPVMTEVIDAAGRGMPVLGICNGFQILCESHLLPGALIRNDHRKFVCKDQRLRIENNRTPWTSAYAENAEVTIVLKNGEGGFVADDATLDRLEGEGQVVARYLVDNPNGSMRDIAGITNAARQRGRPDAAPRARGRGPHRCRHRRARVLHLAGRGHLRLIPRFGAFRLAILSRAWSPAESARMTPRRVLRALVVSLTAALLTSVHGPPTSAEEAPDAEIRIQGQAFEGPRGTILGEVRVRCAPGLVATGFVLQISQGDVVDAALAGAAAVVLGQPSSRRRSRASRRSPPGRPPSWRRWSWPTP